MDERRIVQIMPSEGWRAAYRLGSEDSPDGKVYSYPLLGWGLQADGHIVPLEAAGNSWVEDPTGANNFVRLIPPGEAERREPELDEEATTPFHGFG